MLCISYKFFCLLVPLLLCPIHNDQRHDKGSKRGGTDQAGAGGTNNGGGTNDGGGMDEEGRTDEGGDVCCLAQLPLNEPSQGGWR